MSFLTLNNITHHFFSKTGGTKAIDNISFTVQRGEFISILGPSGCGKSTLLSIVAGLLQQTEGDVLLKGKPLHDSEQAIGYMLQQDYLFPWKTIIDNILLGSKISKQDLDKQKRKALIQLKEVGLEDIADAYPQELSGGMRQRAALVRTLVNDPEILLLDEPFSALDYLTKLKLEDLVSKLFKTYCKTALLVTHDIGEAISMSDRIIVLGANPGSISKIFEIPVELRNERPFLVRRHPKYQFIFDKIWDELNKHEPTFTTEKVVSKQHETTDG